MAGADRRQQHLGRHSDARPRQQVVQLPPELARERNVVL